MGHLLCSQARICAPAAHPSKGLVALILFGTLATPLQAQLDTVPAPRPHVVMAVGQTIVLNTIINRLDALVRKRDWAQVGTRSWARNFRLGWDWDEDAFPTNVFAHPYHGAVYFNTARANGVDFFESIPITLFATWTWEYFGENERPSLNDFLLTGFGGVNLGEIFHRAAASMRDNTEHGARRTLREIAAMPVDPMGSLNRLFRGDWKHVGPNSDAHDPDAYVLRLGAGARVAQTTMDAVIADVYYGDQFAGPYRTPFDVFNLRIIAGARGGLSNFQAAGRLYAHFLNDSTARIRHVLVINQHYDYVKNRAQSFGGQSVEIGIASRWRLSTRPKGYGVRTAVYLDGIILGAIDAPGTGTGLRDYDFGSGGGVRWEAAFERHGARFLLLHGRLDYMHTVSGTAADHLVNVSGVELTIPITRRLGIAAHTYIFDRESHYTDRGPDKRDYPEGRLLLVWTRAASKP